MSNLRQVSDKLIYNWFKHSTLDFSDENVLRDVVYYASQDPIHAEWASELWEKYEQKEEKSAIASINRILTREKFKEILKFFEEKCNTLEPMARHHNIEMLSSVMELTPIETEVLNLALFIGHSTNASSIGYDTLDRIHISNGCNNLVGLYSRLLDMPYGEVSSIVDGFLIKSRIVSKETRSSLLLLSTQLVDLFTSKNLTEDKLIDHYFSSTLSTKLTVDHYPHMKSNIEIVEGIVNQSLKNNSIGTNILLWGLAGTGKTELVISLAKKNGWELISIADSSSNNLDEKNRSSTALTGLKLAQKLFANRPNTILLFDEMEDIIKDDKNSGYSKAFINRTMELATMPILWTTNNIRIADQSFLRRMTYNIEFSTPPVETRKKAWATYSDDLSVNLSQNDIDYLSNRYDVIPAIIHNVMKTSSATGNKSRDYFHDIIVSLDTLFNHGKKRTFPNIDNNSDIYDVSCVNTEADLVKFTERLTKTNNRTFSLCLHGPSGTGKSQYAKHLASELGMQYSIKKASDLISMWVGGTEQNIAEAFDDALKNNKVLIFDEGDSFLQERNGAKNSWEITMVNEMLTQIENHPLPFVVTTNLFDNIDSASLRRFTFDMKFDFLKTDQAKRLFEIYFNLQPTSELDELVSLTPGDFAKVSKKVKILGIDDAIEIVGLLEKEIQNKKLTLPNKFGFI